MPTPEITRAHIRNAIELMCSRPPTMGLSGFNQLWAFVRSDAFPLNLERAKTALKHSVFKRLKAKTKLDFVYTLIVSPVLEEFSIDEMDRIGFALKAINELEPVALTNVRTKVNTRFNGLTDEERRRSFHIFYEAPILLDLLDPHILSHFQEQARVLNSEKHLVDLIYAASNPAFSEMASRHLGDLSSSALSLLLELSSVPANFDAALSSFKEVDAILEGIIVPFISKFSEQQLKQLLKISAENSSVTATPNSRSEFFLPILSTTAGREFDVRDQWETLYEITKKKWPILAAELRKVYDFV
jgi:hypothetical protein